LTHLFLAITNVEISIEKLFTNSVSNPATSNSFWSIEEVKKPSMELGRYSYASLFLEIKPPIFGRIFLMM